MTIEWGLFMCLIPQGHGLEQDRTPLCCSQTIREGNLKAGCESCQAQKRGGRGCLAWCPVQLPRQQRTRAWSLRGRERPMSDGCRPLLSWRPISQSCDRPAGLWTTAPANPWVGPGGRFVVLHTAPHRIPFQRQCSCWDFAGHQQCLPFLVLPFGPQMEDPVHPIEKVKVVFPSCLFLVQV